MAGLSTVSVHIPIPHNVGTPGGGSAMVSHSHNVTAQLTDSRTKWLWMTPAKLTNTHVIDPNEANQAASSFLDISRAFCLSFFVKSHVILIHPFLSFFHLCYSWSIFFAPCSNSLISKKMLSITKTPEQGVWAAFIYKMLRLTPFYH